MSQPPSPDAEEEQPQQPEQLPVRRTPRPGGSRERVPGATSPLARAATPPPPREPEATRPPRPPAQPRPAAARPTSGARPQARQSAPPPRRPTPPTQGRDTLPLVIAGVVGVLLLGLLAVFAFSSNPTSVPLGNITGAATPTEFFIEVGVTSTPVASSAEPPRIPLDEFKAEYDKTADRPLIVDVRAPDTFAEGHINGAINVTSDELPGGLNRLPKDKMIVLYCQ